MAYEARSPFQQFVDSVGYPINNGSLYVGTANLSAETNPIQVYWDEAGTIPALQPLNVSGGYIVRNGTPARIYTIPDDYSMTLKTSTGVTVWSALSVTSTETLRTDLAGSGGSALVGFKQSYTGSVNRTVQDVLRQVVYVEDFGAVGDGYTDDTAAFQAAINALQGMSVRDMEIHLRAKPYRIVGSLEVTGPIRFFGEGVFDLDNARPITRPEKGTWMIHASPTGHMIRFTGATGKCCGMTGIGIFQEGHATPTLGWSPSVRDWVIRNENTQGTLILDRVHFHNVYQGVFTDFAVRPQYENITGQFFYRGFWFDRIYDLGKFEGLHAWTYWSEDDNVLDWTQANCVEITLLRVDGLWMDRIFAFATAVGIYVGVSSYGGSARVIYVNGLYADFVGRAIVVDSSSPAHLFVDNLFHLGQVWASSPADALSGACGLDISSGSNHNIQVSNFYSALSATHAVKVAGTSNQVWFGSAIMEQYSRASSGNGACTAAATNILHFSSAPSLNPYAGGLSDYFNGTPGGIVAAQTKQVVTTETVNEPVTSGNSAGQLCVYTAEGETNAGVTLQAKGTGVTQIGTASNQVGFFGSLGSTKPTGVAVSAAGIHAALVSLGLIS